MHRDIPLRTCRACWSGVPCNRFHPRSNRVCDGCMARRQRESAADAIRRIASVRRG